MKNQNSKSICPDGNDLASRRAARNLRSEVEQIISTGKVATIDLTGVISISESYADELFAILVAQHGLSWFSANVKLLHQPPHASNILRSIAIAIRRRLADQESQTIKITVDNLIAAKKTGGLRATF